MSKSLLLLAKKSVSEPGITRHLTTAPGQSDPNSINTTVITSHTPGKICYTQEAVDLGQKRLHA